MKVHALVDARGLPIRMVLTAGQVHDSQAVPALLEGLTANSVLIADKGYDADHLHQAVLDAGAEPVIPARSNRGTPRDYNKTLYKERNQIERFFNKLKQFRRVATRYDKLLANYEGFVQLAAIAILLR